MKMLTYQSAGMQNVRERGKLAQRRKFRRLYVAERFYRSIPYTY